MGLLLILSLLFAGSSWGFFWWASVLESRTRALGRWEELPVSQLIQDAGAVAQELGAGSFRQGVRVRGRIVCEQPLTAELSNTSCVSYRFRVTREYEEVSWKARGGGRMRQRVRRRSEEVAANEVATDFYVEDATGRILVRSGQARFEMQKSHASFAPLQGSARGYGVGRFVVDHDKAPGGTLGYRYEEFCLPVGHEVTIMAEAGDNEAGVLSLGRPDGENSPFLVTTKSQSEMVARAKGWIAAVRGGGWGMAAIAVLIFLLGVVR